MHRILILSLLFLFFTCGDDTKDENLNNDDPTGLIQVYRFAKTIDLTGTNVGPRDVLNSPQRIIRSNGYYLLADGQGPQRYHLLDKELNIIASLPRDASRQLPPTKLFRQPFMEAGKVYEYVYDREIKGHDIILGDPARIVDTPSIVSLPQQTYNVQNIVLLDSTRFAGLGGMLEGKVYVFDVHQPEQITITDYIPDLPTVDARGKIDLYNGPITYEPTQDKIVAASHRFNQLEVYTPTGELVHQLRYGKGLKTPLDQNESMHYFDLDTDDRYIYALYLGQEHQSMLEHMIDKMRPAVHVYDWNGNPIVSYQLDRLISGFVVDRAQGTIYGLDDTQETQRLVAYSFQLPE